MPARPLGSATIAFGLVSIPVKLYSAAESAATVRFNQIDRRDGSRVKQQLISSGSGEIVPREDIVKGYEFAKGQYVLFSPEEIKALEVAATYTIDVDQFLPDGAVDRIYFDKAYYLGPDKGGARAYHLLAEAMRETGRVALGRYAARGRQHLVLVRPKEKGLLLEQLHYADEVRSFSEVPLEEIEVKESELKLAKQLIDQAATDNFDPTTYRDEVRDQVRALIQRKVEGEDITIAPAAQPEHKIIDLMEALKASLNATDKRKPAKRTEAERTEAEQAEPKKAGAKGKAKATSRKTPRKKRAG
ncbi:MAG TPA: Ku protein [Woeseiaceae bacterium]|nr:Ku protein [Woeseiaceae bacterium]